MTETVQDLVEAYLKARRWQNRRWYNPKFRGQVSLMLPTLTADGLVVEKDRGTLEFRALYETRP